MSNKVLAYSLAGGILLLTAEFAPKIATATTGLILFGVLLTHGNQLKAVNDFISQNTGA